MGHRRPLEEVVSTALTLARNLPAAQQSRAMGTLLGLAYHYIGEAAFDRLMEGLMATNILESVLAKSLAQGFQQGID